MCLRADGQDPLARNDGRRSVERHFWSGNLSADQQCYEQRCNEQTTRDHAEKTNVAIVVSHFTLLHDNSRCHMRFRRPPGAPLRIEQFQKQLRGVYVLAKD
jgi:hypothetical protein